MTQLSGVTTSVGGETTPGREKRGDYTSCLTRILLGKKLKKIHTVDLIGTNG
jgi:hypothetical protein